MSTATTDLFVTIVSSDRELLCDLSWTLSQFGYQVTAISDFSDENPCWRDNKSSLLLIDTRANDEAVKALALPQTPNFVYRIALDVAESVDRMLLQGADDVVRYPVNTGELLTRLRAGVRRLEFERRLSQRRRRDPATGLLTRQSLCQDLSSTDAAPDSPITSVTFGIDFLSQIQEQYGCHAVRHLRATLARCMGQFLESGEIAGVLGENAFLAALRRPSDAACQFAETVVAAFASSDTLVREIRSLPTLSASIAEWDTNAVAVEQLERCESTLAQVHYFGGNHIAAAADVLKRITDWRNELDAGAPFEDIVAQDLMELFPAILTHEHAQADYEAALPSTERHLPCIPVVDDDGRLAGAVQLAKSILPSQPSNGQPQTIEYNQPLSDLFEAFNTTECDYLVVVDDQGCPLGYITCESLASLVLDPMNAARYRSSAESDSSVTSLVVPVVPVQTADPPPVVSS